ncbi:hypothetical protein K2173_009002 [Erythroxylum novogranatense]|uniref:Uncharacterized protein n=1 Tax=Erythroxylum novogranatense TaxID=1862640 RepID=A0AAV8TVK1_9ROSI|nr:hypothetical protein K2173_009002 [Erythroxylum novogranatense]
MLLLLHDFRVLNKQKGDRGGHYYPTKAHLRHNCRVLHPPHEANLEGSIRGISLKLQEEECNHSIDFVSNMSTIKTNKIIVDKESVDMLAALGMFDIIDVIQVVDLVLCR